MTLCPSPEPKELLYPEGEVLRVTAVIPAYNEASRIGAVLAVLVETPGIDQIVVVSDGSTDNTYQVASAVPQVRAIQLDQNVGKGGAMRVGAEEADADVLLFLDADLIGLRSEHVEQLLAPVVSGQAPMALGVFQGGRWITDMAQVLFPYVSGQRAMRRDLFLEVPHLEKVRSGVEMAITWYVKSKGISVKPVVLTGITHPMKEEKLGYFRGFLARTGMYAEIIRFMLNGKTPVESREQGSGIRESDER